MDDKKTLLASVVVAVVAIALGVALVFGGRSNVSVSVTSDGKPVVVAGSEEKFGAYAPVASEETVWTSGKFTDDLTVGDAVAVTGNATIGGSLSITGTTTFSGEVSGVPKALSITMSSSATTTACTALNNSGTTRVVLGAGVVDRGSAASLGSVAWQAGTSTANGANGASTISYTKVVNAALTRLSGVDVLTTTSTLLGSSGAYSTWESGSYFNFISGTTTNSGSCKILYY